MQKYWTTVVYKHSKSEHRINIFVDEAETSPLYRIDVFLREYRITTEDPCFFKAFQKMRDQVLEYGYGMKCCGALKNAVQLPEQEKSNMICLLELEKPISKARVVNMFMPCTVPKYANTRQQDKFYEEWKRSIRRVERQKRKQEELMIKESKQSEISE